MEGRSRRFIQRYTFADFFDRLFAILKHTWKTSVLGGLLLVGIPAVILGLLVPFMFSTLGETISGAESMSDREAMRALRGLIGWNGALFLVGLITVVLSKLAALAVIHRVRDAVFEVDSSWTVCIGDALRNSLWPAILQNLLKGLAVFAVVLVPTLLVAIASAIGGGGAAALIIGMTIVYAGVAAAVIWILYAFLFSEYAIVFDRERVIPGLKRSYHLVMGNWWRLFGISLLLGIALSFATGLITTPLVGASMLPIAGRMIESGLGGEINDAEIARILSNAGGFGIAVALATIIQQLVTLLIMPVFYSLFYIDLKVRAGELDSPDETQPPEGESGPRADAEPDGGEAPQ